MTEADKICPQCGAQYRWYDNECLDCHVALEQLPESDPEPVIVFQTTDRALVPLATIALDQAGIAHEVGSGGTWGPGGRPGDPLDDRVVVVVRAGDAERARELLAELNAAVPEEAKPLVVDVDRSQVVAPAIVPNEEQVSLFDPGTGRTIGHLTFPQFDSLAALLEREDSDDNYYIDEPTLTMLEEGGADAAAVALLRGALAGRSGMDVQYVQAERDPDYE